jgi:hypothetical protein
LDFLAADVDLALVVLFTMAEEVRHGLAPQHSWMYVLFDFTPPFKHILVNNNLHFYLFATDTKLNIIFN